MATTLTPSHPQFVFVFAAVRRADRKPRIRMLRTVAGDEHVFPSLAITSSRSLAVCRLRRCAHETLHHYHP